MTLSTTGEAVGDTQTHEFRVPGFVGENSKVAKNLPSSALVVCPSATTPTVPPSSRLLEHLRQIRGSPPPPNASFARIIPGLQRLGPHFLRPFTAPSARRSACRLQPAGVYAQADRDGTPALTDPQGIHLVYRHPERSVSAPPCRIGLWRPRRGLTDSRRHCLILWPRWTRPRAAPGKAEKDRPVQLDGIVAHSSCARVQPG